MNIVPRWDICGARVLLYPSGTIFTDICSRPSISQLKDFGMSIRVSRKIDLPRVHWDETEFSLDPPLNKKIAIATAERLSRGILKTLPKNKRCLICNKDDIALKTSTKMVVYTNKCICPGNIWWVFIIRVNTRANIVWQSDFGKDSLTNFI